MADLPSQWTHEPSAVLRFRPGDTVAGIDTDATPGFAGTKAEAATIASAITFLSRMAFFFGGSRDDEDNRGGGSHHQS